MHSTEDFIQSNTYWTEYALLDVFQLLNSGWSKCYHTFINAFPQSHTFRRLSCFVRQLYCYVHSFTARTPTRIIRLTFSYQLRYVRNLHNPTLIINSVDHTFLIWIVLGCTDLTTGFSSHTSSIYILQYTNRFKTSRTSTHNLCLISLSTPIKQTLVEHGFHQMSDVYECRRPLITWTETEPCTG